MQGRTEAEVNALAEQLANVAARAVTQPQPQMYASPQVQQPPAQTAIPDFAPDDWVTGRTLLDMQARSAQQTQEALRQQYGPMIQQTAELAASANLENVKDRYKEEFAKYGPEIYGHLGNIPKHLWTIDNLRGTVDFVRGKHVDEIAQRRAEELLATGSPTIRTSGAGVTAGPPGPTDPVAALSPEKQEFLKKQGITLKVVEDFCAKNPGWTPTKWFDKFGARAVGDAV